MKKYLPKILKGPNIFGISWLGIQFCYFTEWREEFDIEKHNEEVEELLCLMDDNNL